MRAVRLLLSSLLLLTACVGPEAPDAALCRDVITRICVAPHCSSVDAQLNPGMDCVATLSMKTGCGSDDFVFAKPTRERFLECRVPLVRLGAERAAAPGCDNVDEMFNNCPDVVAFLRGTTP